MSWFSSGEFVSFSVLLSYLVLRFFEDISDVFVGLVDFSKVLEIGIYYSVECTEVSAVFSFFVSFFRFVRDSTLF